MDWRRLMPNTMMGNIVPLPDGSYTQFEEGPEITFEDTLVNIGMCINVHGECVGKITGDRDADIALKTLAENSHPNDGGNYTWNSTTQSWVTAE